ncbi:uncharacterized protein LOC118202705, partial [Stegodyphus dumicola]|uniref:uncharacterized protein LOC118202705 n=1 Tax=Stegodyphus dumicola TaxID=202533 RepID=UPI0015B1EBC7
SNDDPCEKGSHSIANKPMRAADYALVEQELLRQQSKIDMPSKSLKNQQGWSSHSLDESDEEFHLMRMENRISPELENSTLNDNDSFCSSISSDARSDYAYNTFGASQRTSKARSSSVQAMLQDHMTELTHFRCCCSSVCIIILHDDSVQESLSNNSNSTQELDLKSTLSLKDRASTFFNDLLALQMSGFDFKDFEMAKDPLSKLCETNHLRLMASSVAIDGNEKSSSAQCILNFSLSLFQFEVLECLFDSANVVHKSQTPTYVQILSCENKLNSQDSSGLELQEACFKLKYQQVECTSQNSIIKLPPNKLDIQIGPMKCEVDISLTDRIRTLLKFPNFFSQVDSKNNEWRDCDVGINTRVSPKTEISISSPNLKINLR